MLWIDELEKAFSGLGTARDSGVTQRLFGCFPTWLEDHEGAVFTVAIANEIEPLPAEFLRKGRFDEVFFVDLPSILRLEMLRRETHSPVVLWDKIRPADAAPPEEPLPLELRFLFEILAAEANGATTTAWALRPIPTGGSGPPDRRGGADLRSLDRGPADPRAQGARTTVRIVRTVRPGGGFGSRRGSLRSGGSTIGLLPRSEQRSATDHVLFLFRKSPKAVLPSLSLPTLPADRPGASVRPRLPSCLPAPRSPDTGRALRQTISKRSWKTPWTSSFEPRMNASGTRSAPSPSGSARC